MSENNPTEKNNYWYLEKTGTLSGHNGWVTAIRATADPSKIVSSSRDKTIMVWKLSLDRNKDYGIPVSRLYGHEHFVEDVAVSSDGFFALSGSWDKTLRLWNLEKRECVQRFVYHTKDVLGVSFSADNRQICSGSRDKKVVIWNTIGQKSLVLVENTNPDWISCVAFSPKKNEENEEEGEGKNEEISGKEQPSREIASDTAAKTEHASVSSKETSAVKTVENAKVEHEEGEEDEKSLEDNNLDFFVFGSWNGTAKKFDLRKSKITQEFSGHDGAITALAISPDASLCATGGKDGRVLLWDLKCGQKLRELFLDEAVVSLKFNPGEYWLCGASSNCFRVWDLVRENQLICEYDFKSLKQKCTAIEWETNRRSILCGFTDGTIDAIEMMTPREGAGPVAEEIKEETAKSSDLKDE